MRAFALVVALLAPAAAVAADAPVATVEVRAQGRALTAEYRLPQAVAKRRQVTVKRESARRSRSRSVKTLLRA